MLQYKELVEKVLRLGNVSHNRTGIDAISIFGETIKFDLREGFPAITTKKLAWKAVVGELLWFLSGSTNVNDLRAITYGESNRFNCDKKTIWDDNFNAQGKSLGYKDGELGDIYGFQWRNFNGSSITPGCDQIKAIINEAKSNPESRRLVVSAWNPNVVWDTPTQQVNQAALPPCHYSFQINIETEFIDLLWNQRSVDVGLGLPFNIASYALLLSILAQILNKTPRYVIGQLGNVHIYCNHVQALQEQIQRPHWSGPSLSMPEFTTLEQVLSSKVDDYILVNYNHHSTVSMQMAV